MAFQHQALVFGHGDCAREVARLLDAHGIGIVLADSAGPAAAKFPQLGDESRIKVIQGRLTGCRGQAGAFQVRFDGAGAPREHTVACIVVAEEALHTPNYSAYGLPSSQRVMALSDAEARFAAGSLETSVAPAAQVAFLNGWHTDSHPAAAARMLRLCLHIQKSGGRSAYLTGNLKVACEGMEALYLEAKAAGSVFLKFSERFPELDTLPDGRIRIDYWDETTRRYYRLEADYVIVDEQIQAHPYLTQLAQVLRLDCDAAGYLQSENVRRLSNSTNRRGIFVAGASRTIAAPEQQRADAAQAALNVAQLIVGLDGEQRPEVQIDQGRCARCLTCYRLCPYAAIEMAPRMTIVAQACQSCGLCAAGCPNQAIVVDDPHLQKALQTFKSLDTLVPAADPHIVAFCCSRSAAQAREAAIRMGHRLPPGMKIVEGLCGGTFSVNHLLNAFDAGVDGVMILTCHPGNCHSENGTTHARKRAAKAAGALAAAGVEPERIAYSTLSANMGTELVRFANDFARRVAALGPVFGTAKQGRHQEFINEP